MVRGDLWSALGGFDERYAPAYYEDTDLCFAIRREGYKVYYQPHSVVVHFEGQTAGTDLQSGFKRFQVINHAKFREKWARELGDYLPNDPAWVERAALRHTRGALLVVDPFLPFYDRASGSLRLFHLLKIYRRLGYHVTFVSR